MTLTPVLSIPVIKEKLQYNCAKYSYASISQVKLSGTIFKTLHLLGNMQMDSLN
jgi:hypothetical protein